MMAGAEFSDGSSAPHSSLLEELWQAFHKARRHKRSKTSVMEMEIWATRNLVGLAEQLEARTWQPGRYTAFLVQKPVLREIFAAPFADRIVHHLLFRRIAPVFERQLIHDCASCRIGKGTHFAINRVKRFLRAASNGHRDPVWVLRLDIRAYFVSIRRDILYRECHAMLAKSGLNARAEWSLTEWLLAQICFHDPILEARRNGSDAEWGALPRSKSLYHSLPGCGLPIGNLTSQLFGNVYLNGLDQFIKRDLGIQCYSRYVDDMVLLHPDRSVLLDCIQSIGEWLQVNRSLHLHPQKTHLSLARAGFPYLGAFLLPGRIYAGKRVKEAFVRCSKQSVPEPQALQSYVGLLGHWDCYRLVARLAHHNATKICEGLVISPTPSCVRIPRG